MANHKSAKKRILTNAKKRAINKGANSKLKTLFNKAFEESEKTAVAEQSYKEAVSFIDKMVDKGRLHKNTGARKKSQLTKQLNSLTPVKA